VLCLEHSDDCEEDAKSSRSEGDKILTGGDSNTMTWKDQIIQYIEEQGGSYLDQKW